MELRPMQAALFAGRYASRRATAAPSPLSYPSIPSFYRCFSSTRPTLSEAEAAAPAPPPSMQEWHQQQQQQQQQQSAQPQTRTWETVAGNGRTNIPSGGFASLLRSTTSSPPSPLPTTPAPTSNDARNPWAQPMNPGLRRAQANRKASDAGTPGIIDTLNDMELITPNTNDLSNYPWDKEEPASDIKYRLRPSVGRTIHLDTKVDLARGLGLLNTRVRTNKIAQDLAKQRFHERPGLKRKRLRSERWRARFKDGFKATCSRVQELARQGW